VPNEELAAYLERRASGGAGLIVVEGAGVHESGSLESIIMANDRASIPGYRRIADQCHAAGSLVFGQLFHPGRETRGKVDAVTKVAWAPSALPGDRHHVMPRPMPRALIKDVVKGYGESAGNLVEAGLDGVEILASHGYLISQFLSPRINHRKDEYGGNLENRMRFFLEVLASVRESMSDKTILGVRLSADAKSSDGATIAEMTEICRVLEQKADIDYLSFVAGSAMTLAGSIHIVPPMEIPTAYVADMIRPIRESTKLPVMVTGRINQPQIAENVLDRDIADFCGMTRAMIADPDMPNKAKAGRLDDIRACVGCNQACSGHSLYGFPVSCIQFPESGRELTLANIQPAKTAKQVMVIGGGPAGMKAATIASRRGHHVELFERGPRLGGQVLLAEKLPSRAEFGGVATNLVRECESTGIAIQTNFEVTANYVAKVDPDVVIVATGGTPFWPQIEKSDDAHVVSAWQVIDGSANIGSSVVIADWKNDWVGMGVAEMLATKGCHVRLFVNGPMAGEKLQMYVRDALVSRVQRLGIEIVPYMRLFGVDEDTVYFQHALTEEPILCDETDTLVISYGNAVDTTLVDQLEDFAGEIHVIGDSLAPRSVEEAIYEGLVVGRTI